jgi:hypothetical protein
VKGGNAIKFAYCLAKLGAQVKLFTIADEVGSLTLNKIFSKFGNYVDLRVVKGSHCRTTALEFVGKNEPRINLLISDVGDNIDFGPQYVNSQSDLETLRKCDGVMVVNWASNLKGTQLAKHAFRKSFVVLQLCSKRRAHLVVSPVITFSLPVSCLSPGSTSPDISPPSNSNSHEPVGQSSLELPTVRAKSETS